MAKEKGGPVTCRVDEGVARRIAARLRAAGDTLAADTIERLLGERGGAWDPVVHQALLNAKGAYGALRAAGLDVHLPGLKNCEDRVQRALVSMEGRP